MLVKPVPKPINPKRKKKQRPSQIKPAITAELTSVPKTSPKQKNFYIK